MLKSHKQTILETLGRSPIHPFPARMAPGIALEALGASDAPLRVLDPMSGSGTVLAVARSKGHRAFGVDVDPLAVLLARVWTTPIDAEKVSAKALEVLSRARLEFEKMSSAEAYPDGSDEETRKFIRYWFDDYARKQLAALAKTISRVHDETMRNVLWCGFSRLIITKSAGASLAMDLSHSRPHREFATAPVKPFNRFTSAVSTVVANCPHERSGNVGPAAVVKLGDARKLDIPKASIDLVLTSPPYLNAIDYMRCSKFSLVWMGHSIGTIRSIRGESVGTEIALDAAQDSESIKSIIKKLRLTPRLSQRHQGLLARYVWDMQKSLGEASRVLRIGGRAVYVVGDCTVRGTFIRNSSIVAAAAEGVGLTLDSRQSRALPANRRYMPPPKRESSPTGMDSRMRREVVLAFSKAS